MYSICSMYSTCLHDIWYIILQLRAADGEELRGGSLAFGSSRCHDGFMRLLN